MAMLDPGRMRWRVRLEREGEPTHDGLRNVPGAPVELGTVWAEYVPSPGRERFDDSENAARAPSLFRIHWTAAFDPDRVDAPEGLNPKDWLRFPAREDGRRYNIVSANTMGWREGIEIIAEARSDR